MYAGFIVETATTAGAVRPPRHPYTVGLLNSISRIDAGADGAPPDRGLRRPRNASRPRAARSRRAAPGGCRVCWRENPTLGAADGPGRAGDHDRASGEPPRRLPQPGDARGGERRPAAAPGLRGSRRTRRWPAAERPRRRDGRPPASATAVDDRRRGAVGRRRAPARGDGPRGPLQRRRPVRLAGEPRRHQSGRRRQPDHRVAAERSDWSANPGRARRRPDGRSFGCSTRRPGRSGSTARRSRRSAASRSAGSGSASR